MNIIQRFILFVVSSVVGLLIARYFIIGFSVSTYWRDLLMLGLALAVANIFIKPIVSFFLKPLIYLTLGILSLVINAVILYIIDLYFHTLDIATLNALIWGTLIISLVNYVIHLFGERVAKPHDNLHV